MREYQTIGTGRVDALARQYSDRSERIVSCLEKLAGPDSIVVLEMRAARERFLGRSRILAQNRGLRIPAFVFVGENGAGKTALIDLLAGESVVAGDVKGGGLSRARWVGPEPPSNLDHAFEECRVVSAEAMADLGRPYLLIDTPGLGQRPAAEGALRRALMSTKLKVVVLERRRLGAETWVEELKRASGSIVLPVVRLEAKSSQELEQDRDEIQRHVSGHMRRLRESLGSSTTLLEEVLIPDFESDRDPRAVRLRVRDQLVDTLRNVLERYGDVVADREAELVASWAEFVEESRPMIAPLRANFIEVKHRDLEEAIRALPEGVVDRLLENRHRLRALFRLDLRGALMEAIPLWAFPFRTVAGMLCLTTGLWDRLVVGLAGSLPSALMTAIGAAKGWRDEAAAAKSNTDWLRPRISGMVRDMVAGPLHDFRAALARQTEGVSEAGSAPVEFDVRGTEALAASWQEAQREAADKERRTGRAWINIFSIVGMLVFWLLFTGPLVHTYGQYVPAAIDSLFGQWDNSALASYPTMGGGFWMTALVLSMMPVFLLALVLVAWRLSARRITRCVGYLETKVRHQVNDGLMPLDIILKDERVLAYRDLLREIDGAGK